jgi:hypothetical protein
MFWELIQGIVGAIRDLLGARRERRANRPYFIFQRSEVWGRADGKYGMRIRLRNSGPHIAANLSLRIGLVDPRLDRSALYECSGKQPQVLPDSEVVWEEPEIVLASETRAHYIYVDARYIDPLTDERYRQFFARLWGGVSGGKVSEIFRPVSEQEEAKVRRFVEAAP